VIVNNLNIRWPIIGPREAHSPLIVDPDAVLASPISCQRFQPVPRGRPQIFQLDRCIQHGKLPRSDRVKIYKLLCPNTLVKLLCLLTCKRSNHLRYLFDNYRVLLRLFTIGPWNFSILYRLSINDKIDIEAGACSIICTLLRSCVSNFKQRQQEA